MEEERIKCIIKKAEEKMKLKQNVKDEKYALSLIYEYIETEYGNEKGKLLTLIKTELDIIEAYQEKEKKAKKEKIKRSLKLEKIHQYEMIWSTKSFLYKLTHKNLNPKNNDLYQMNLDDIEQLINTVKEKK